MITLILIGGHSRRMGRDKWTILRPDGQGQLDHLVALARAGGNDEVMLSLQAGGTPPAALPCLHDPAGLEGPLAALAAFHQARPGQPVRLLSCDLFLLDASTLAELTLGRDARAGATCFAHRLDGRPEPLAAIYEAGSIARAAAASEAGERRVRVFLESLAPRVLTPSRPAALDNANTPGELAECFAKLQHGVTPKTVWLTGEAPSAFATLACTLGGLYAERRFLHRLPDPAELIPIKNGEPCEWDSPVHEGDEVEWRRR